MRSLTRLLLALLVAGGIDAQAQDASLAPDDILFTRGIADHYHTAAVVTLNDRDGPTRYHYDCYPLGSSGPEKERIKYNAKSYVRIDQGAWQESDDWGATGTPVDAAMTAALNTYANIIGTLFVTPTSNDPAQGEHVWKFIAQTQSKDGTNTYYTYELTREHPHPNGVYPRYTFMKAAGDVDGQLFLSQSTGNLIMNNERVPFEVDLVYLIPLPAKTKVEVYDQTTGKKKLDQVVGKDSGWEITSQQSAPPKSN